MITLNIDIPQICLSGSPIVVSGTSTCVAVQNSTLHRAVLHAECKNGSTKVYEDDLVCNLDSSMTAAPFIFNLSDIAQAAYRRATTYGLDTNGLPAITRTTLTMTFSIKEAYLLDGSTTTPSSGAYTHQAPFIILPGAWTDEEREYHADRYDMTEYLNSARLMSRKPSRGDVALAEHPVYIPLCGAYVEATEEEDEDTGETTTTDAYIGDAHISASYTGQTTALTSGDVTFGSVRIVPPLPYKTYTLFVGNEADAAGTLYAVPAQRDRRELVFVNGFGLLESAVCVSNETLERSVKVTSLLARMATRFGLDRSGINLSRMGNKAYGLSSGAVTKEWAEWWLTEVCCSPHAWMYDREKDRWLSGVIVPSEKNTIYDRSKADAPAISFSFVCDEK